MSTQTVVLTPSSTLGTPTMDESTNQPNPTRDKWWYTQGQRHARNHSGYLDFREVPAHWTELDRVTARDAYNAGFDSVLDY